MSGDNPKQPEKSGSSSDCKSDTARQASHSAEALDSTAIEEALQVAIDANLKGTALLTRTGQVVTCNSSFARQFGCTSPTDLVGKECPCRADAPSSNKATNIVDSWSEKGEPSSIDAIVTKIDGSEKNVRLVIYPVQESLTPDNVIVRVDGVGSRRTRHSEQYLNQMAALVDGTRDAIISKTLDGTISSWNRGAEAIYFYGQSEAIGKSISLILPAEIHEEESEIRDAIQRGEQIEQFLATRRRKDGREITVSLTVSPIFDEHDNIVGASSIERDVTDRTVQEQELKKARDDADAARRRAEKALEVRGEFLAKVSHELRTPMNAILGMLHIALEEVEQTAVQDYLETAQTSAKSLLTLLNDILDFSRIDSGKIELVEEAFQLRDLLDETVKIVSAGAFRKGLELVVEVDAAIPDSLVGDSNRLRQILTNLVGNAIKFTDSGEIIVSITPVRIWPHEARLKFSVRDTGFGISEENRERIFKAFEQGDSSSTRQHGGVGLGLAICNQLLRQMGSRLRVETELGTGSEFWSIVSFRRIADEKTKPSGLPMDQLLGLPVLVVDDNDTSRRILDQMLTNWGMQPKLAASGEEALELLAESSHKDETISLAIVDTLMPGMDGFALIDEVQNNDAIETPKVILMSSTADRQTVPHRNDDRVLDYLMKPVSQSDLLDTVFRGLSVTPPAELDEVVDHVDDPRQSLKVLLAEDTLANQKIVQSILGKRGHEVTVANNGRDAVDWVATQPFDVVLMDVQMPVLDGYQATEAIRTLPTHQASSIPIIAMTAHAMQGDREHCLRAGMDAFLAKPVDAGELIQLVESVPIHQHLPKNRSPEKKSRKAVEQPNVQFAHLAVMDLSQALARLRNDNELLDDLIQIFLEDSPTLLTAIEHASSERDATALNHSAHKLKGLAAQIGGLRTAAAAKELEAMGKVGDFTDVEAKVRRQVTFLNELISALSKRLEDR